MTFHTNSELRPFPDKTQQIVMQIKAILFKSVPCRQYLTSKSHKREALKMTVEQALASCFSTYMKLSETNVILTLNFHQLFLLTSLLMCLQNVFFIVRECFISELTQLLVILHH